MQNKYYVILATDIRMYPDTTAEEILLESRNVLETKGEWVLTDLNIKSDTLALAVGSYSEIEYRVSTFNSNYSIFFFFCTVIAGHFHITH